ncbi:hypothetical protein Dimus_019651 [Dionaea muscipula]
MEAPSTIAPLPSPTLVPPSTVTPPSHDSTSVDFNPVDSSLSFRISKLDSSPQTHLNPETFFNLGFSSAISRLVKVTNDDHESKINVNLSMDGSDHAQKAFAEMFKKETISNGLFDLALLITFELVRNGNLIGLPFDPGGPYQSTLSLRTRTIPRGSVGVFVPLTPEEAGLIIPRRDTMFKALTSSKNVIRLR